MLKMSLGLTKTYNQFRNKQLAFINVELPGKEIEKQYGKGILNFWNHIRKTLSTCLFAVAVAGIVELHRPANHCTKQTEQEYKKGN